MTDLAKLRELLAESSQGEWVAVETSSEKYMAWIGIGNAKNRDTVALVDNQKIEIGTVDVEEANANANLICALRNEAPALLDRIDELTAALSSLTARDEVEKMRRRVEMYRDKARGNHEAYLKLYADFVGIEGVSHD